MPSVNEFGGFLDEMSAIDGIADRVSPELAQQQEPQAARTNETQGSDSVTEAHVLKSVLAQL